MHIPGHGASSCFTLPAASPDRLATQGTRAAPASRTPLRGKTLNCRRHSRSSPREAAARFSRPPSSRRRSRVTESARPRSRSLRIRLLMPYEAPGGTTSVYLFACARPRISQNCMYTHRHCAFARLLSVRRRDVACFRFLHTGRSRSSLYFPPHHHI